MRKSSLLFALIFSLLTIGCSQEGNVQEADLSEVGRWLEQSSVRYESLKEGGGKRVNRPEVELTHVEIAAATAGNLQLKGEQARWRATFSIKSLSLPQDWESYKYLTVSVQNTDTEAATVGAYLVGPRNQMVDSSKVAAGNTHRFTFDLNDLPLIAGDRPPYQPAAIKIVSDAPRPVQLSVQGIALQARKAVEGFAAVDKFGQRINGGWEGKVTHDSSLNAARSAESAQLAQATPVAYADQYGGLKGVGSFEATGFFRVDQDAQGVWWFITPEGNPFWSVGVTGVRPKSNFNKADVTKLTGREQIFAELPPRDGEFAEAYLEEEYFSFYLTNLLKKYGDLRTWKNTVDKRLWNWGFNSIGNWSDTLFFRQPNVPFTIAITTNDGPHRLPGGFPDVFDPDWLQYAIQKVAAVEEFAQNPFVLGYFVDNEQGWHHPKSIWKTKSERPARKALVGWLRERYNGELASLNQAWGHDYPSWDSLLTVQDSAIPEGTALADTEGFMQYFADRYFSTIDSLLQVYDPNHLYMGCRFVRRRPSDGLLQVAARYFDVVSVNVYDYQPKATQAYHKATGRPILIGEFHFPLNSERQHPPLYRNFTAEERRELIPQYIGYLAKQPFSIGCHWYQFVDQHPSGRGIDGENQTVGLVDITDKPHPEMVETYRKISPMIKQWHSQSAVQ